MIDAFENEFNQGSSSSTPFYFIVMKENFNTLIIIINLIAGVLIGFTAFNTGKLIQISQRYNITIEDIDSLLDARFGDGCDLEQDSTDAVATYLY